MSSPDVRCFAVGPIQENSYIVRADADAKRAIIVDPGEEPERLLAAVAALDVELDAILITHCHFDHIGAVAPLARATGAPVYCPEIERALLADIMNPMWMPPGFGPFDSHEAEHTLAGGEHLDLAGLRIDVLFTPGHSPGHLTYAISAADTQGGDPGAGATAAAGDAGAPPALLSGDVLFQGSVGRTDLPGADWATLERSLALLLESFPAESGVYPGHMGVTTLARERDTNPFLREIRAAVAPATTPHGGIQAS